MSEYFELKRLALLAKAHSKPGEPAASNPYIFDFLGECTPDLILGLSANYERAQAAATEQAKHLDDISNLLNADISAGGEVLVGMVRDLVAENEGLHRDAERYRWLAKPDNRAVEFDACFDEFGVPIGDAIDAAMTSAQGVES